jgi:RNA polymerase sigma factor (TIGR02999 family)
MNLLRGGGAVDTTDDITAILRQAGAGDREALDRLMPLVYPELKAMAHRRLSGERPDHTLNTTALVHEAYIKLVDQSRIEWANRGHFFSVAAMAMRRILVDQARKHLAQKRGGGREAVSLDSARLSVEQSAETLISLDEALDRLTALDERLGRVVVYRFFGGLTEEESAHLLEVTPRTVRRYWVKAKGLLAMNLAGATS